MVSTSGDFDRYWSLFSCSEAELTWARRPSSLLLELLPACCSPHHSPDWSNRPWIPRPSATQCGPEVGQWQSTTSWGLHNRNTGCDGGWWPCHSTACSREMRWRMRGQTEGHGDIHGCLDKVSIQNIALTMQQWWTVKATQLFLHSCPHHIIYQL